MHYRTPPCDHHCATVSDLYSAVPHDQDLSSTGQYSIPVVLYCTVAYKSRMHKHVVCRFRNVPSPTGYNAPPIQMCMMLVTKLYVTRTVSYRALWHHTLQYHMV